MNRKTSLGLIGLLSARRAIAVLPEAMIGMLVLLPSSIVILFAPPSARAVTISTVPVGNAGNGASTAGHGSVAYDYRIGTTEVTNAQYAEFLNAKAGIDPLALYSSSMGFNVRGGVIRIPEPGEYTYAVKTNMGNKPVNHVSWVNALRFINWLHNGQGSGDTETGAYTLLGGTTTPSNLMDIARNLDAHWWLPTLDEWYKAAYHQPASDGGDSDDYWLYPTASNIVPTVATANSVGDISNPGANVLNYNRGADWKGQDGNVTTVGSAGSESYYGTFDQGGNVSEWSESPLVAFGDLTNNVLGGSYFRAAVTSTIHDEFSVLGGNHLTGFRVATIPEPSTLALAIAGFIVLLVYGWRGQRAV